MQGEAERALRCRPPSLRNRPHFDADSIDSAIPRPLRTDLSSSQNKSVGLSGADNQKVKSNLRSFRLAKDARSLESWLDVLPQTAIPHSAHKNIVTAVVYTADLRSTLS